VWRNNVDTRNCTLNFLSQCTHLTYYTRILISETSISSSGDEIANVNFFYNDTVHVLQNTIDSCINSATDRRFFIARHRPITVFTVEKIQYRAGPEMCTPKTMNVAGIHMLSLAIRKGNYWSLSSMRAEAVMCWNAGLQIRWNNAVQGHSRSPILVTIQSLYTTSY